MSVRSQREEGAFCEGSVLETRWEKEGTTATMKRSELGRLREMGKHRLINDQRKSRELWTLARRSAGLLMGRAGVWTNEEMGLRM